MSNVEFKLDINGLRELLKSDEMVSVLQECGEQIKNDAERLSGGGKYESTVRQATYVAICNVYPADKEAAQDNRKNNTALKALQSSGLPTTKG